MIEIKDREDKVWYILFPAGHYGFVEVGQELKSGQESSEEFDNEADWLTRLNELGHEQKRCNSKDKRR